MAKSGTKRKKHFWESDQLVSGFSWTIIAEFEAHQDHCEFSKKALRQNVDRLNRRLQEALKDLDPEDHDDYFEHMEYARMLTQETLPRIQWYSLFLVVNADFEHCLNEMCKIAQRRLGADLSYKDCQGTGARRAQLYLEKVAGISEPFKMPEWKTAIKLSEVRNKISHTSGSIDKNADRGLVNWIKNHPHIEVPTKYPGTGDRIKIDYEFVRDSVDILRTILQAVGRQKLAGRD